MAQEIDRVAKDLHQRIHALGGLVREQDGGTAAGQLLAEQDQLRYQEVTLHAPAQVQQSAAQSGMSRHTPTKYLSTSAVAINLQAPIGAPPTDSTPLWQRMVAAVVDRVVGAHDVMAATR